MVIAVAYSVLITIVFIYIFILDRKERMKLIEMLVAKDYAYYKSFEQRGDEKPKEHKDMFTVRNEKMKNKHRLE